MPARSTPVLFVVACAVAFAAGWLVRDVVSSDERDTSVPEEAAAPARRESMFASDQGRTPSADFASPRGRDTTSAVPRENSSVASRPTTVADYEARIQAAWDTAHPDAPKPHADEFEFVAQRARDHTDAMVRAAAAAPDSNVKQQVEWLEQRVALQEKRGLAEDGPLTVELRARGRQQIEGDDLPGKLAQSQFDPLDAGTRETEGVGVVGGVPRLGREFVVERVEIDARLGRGSSGDGEIEVSWGGDSYEASVRSNHIRAVFEGASKPLWLGDLKLDVSDGVARVRFVGRVVARDAAPEVRPFAWRADDCVGFLRDGAAIRIQIAAGHGGGTVHLTGATNGRIEEFSPRPVWDANADLGGLKRSTCWTEDAGVLPPGFAFRLTRIDWRARLQGGNSHSTFEVEAPLAKDQKESRIVSVGPSRDAPNKQAELLTGSWSGDRLIDAKNLRELRFTLRQYGMADVTVIGRLERVKR